ncbi:carboxypeptidase-like regulatory domain-containing protein, partial [Pseudomonas aeruginosa]|uniref:carboxypeptidase-like regulatory domain-containing protein n=1 Tax=Pseudomonas aeruginosa TaxID=287 RepID=UPI002B40477B
STAQTTETNVNGGIIDTKNLPVESATISLLKIKDSSVVKIGISDKEGKFSFTNSPLGSYFITISAVGFTTTTSPAFSLSDANRTIKLGILILKEVPKNLTAVVVTSK